MKEIGIPLDHHISRSTFLKGAAAYMALAATRYSPFSQESVNASSENLAGTTNFNLPVETTENKRDDRIESITPTQITVSDTLSENIVAPEIPVDNVGLNPHYKGSEAQNRLDVTVANALIRAHFLSQQFLIDYGDSIDSTPLQNFLGAPFPEPDWDDYTNRLNNSDENFTFPLMAIPTGMPAVPENIMLMRPDLRNGVELNFVHEPGLIGNLSDRNQNIIISSTARVDDNNKLQLDIFSDMATLAPSEPQTNDEAQQHYNTIYGYATLQALQMVSSSLGILYSYTPGHNMYEDHISQFYTFDSTYLSLFPEQGKLLLGPKIGDTFKEAVLNVNFK